MAKSDKPLSDIELNKAYAPPHEPCWAGDTPVNGFDTETADGEIFALSVAWEGSDGFVLQKPNFLTTEDIWRYITHKNARSSLNVWYNLDFDANVMLRHALTQEQMAVLVTNGTVQTDEYEITYIPSKFLKVKDANRNVYTHYDASQFFYTSLENAAEEWLGQDKLTDATNVEKFGKEDGQVNNYIRDNWDSIAEYAEKDAELVRDLWQQAVSVGENLDIPMGRPFSTGYLAESYLNNRLGNKPGIGPKEVAEIAWESYAGGRFEVLKRGDIGAVAGPDINSAYPYVLSHLPDPKTLHWKRKPNASVSDLADADFGFVTVNVSTDESRPIQPFSMKVDGKLKYPALNGQEITVLKDIFVHAYENGYIESHNVKNAWLGYETPGTKFPFQFVNDLYEQRKEFEANGNMKKGMWLKIVLNSMYGKTCQTTPKRQRVEERTQLEEHQDYVASMSLPKQIRDTYQNGFIEWLEAGSWFNPFLASYITGLTRLELHKRVLEHGLEYDTVMLATDSIMIEKKPFEKSDFADDLVQSGLGNWDYDYNGRAFVVGAGIYQIDFDECQKDDCDDCTDGHFRKVKTRGFRETDLEEGLRHAARQTADDITITSNRPQTMGEVLWSSSSVSDIGVFTQSERALRADMDDKRDWPSPVSFGDLLDEKQSSLPVTL